MAQWNSIWLYANGKASISTKKQELFLLLWSGDKRKCGIEFRHSTGSAASILRKVENGRILIGTEYLNTRFTGSLYLHCYLQNIAWRLKYKKSNHFIKMICITYNYWRYNSILVYCFYYKVYISELFKYIFSDLPQVPDADQPVLQSSEDQPIEVPVN